MEPRLEYSGCSSILLAPSPEEMSSSPPASPKGEKRKNSAREEDLVVELDDLVELDDEPMETSTPTRPASTPTHTEFFAANLRQKKLENPDYVP